MTILGLKIALLGLRSRVEARGAGGADDAGGAGGRFVGAGGAKGAGGAGGCGPGLLTGLAGGVACEVAVSGSKVMA
jgi:hypothetical protein